MIDSLYQLVNKGSWRALSLILALGLTLAFFFNIYDFSTHLRIAPVSVTLFILWGTVILWIHGIGLDIRLLFWKLIFLPILGYLSAILAVFYLFN